METIKKILSYFIFYLIQFTWGILHNIIGIVLAIWMLITGHKPHLCGPYIYFVNEKFAGCVDGGIFFVTTNQSATSTNLHEMGHGLQNLIWGPLMVFVICIPSCIRFWYRVWYYEKKYPKTGIALEPYDAIWFEGQATRWGAKYWSHIWYKHLAKQKNN